MNTALVTGATGFVGSRLVNRLLAEGWFVHIIIRDGSSLSELKSILDNVCVHIYNGKLREMKKIVSSCKPDIVFHLASLFLSEHKSEQINNLVTSNITFGVQLLESMVESGVYKIVNTGTSWQHYENMEYNPVNLYAATKQAFQDLLKYYVEAKSVQAITLKLFDTYGPNDPRSKLLSLLLKTAKTGEVLELSPGEQELDLVHIDDVLSAYFLASQYLLNTTAKIHDTYGVRSGKAISLKELVSLIEEQTGKKLNIIWGARPYRRREVMKVWGKCKLLKNWQQEVEINIGIKGLDAE